MMTSGQHSGLIPHEIGHLVSTKGERVHIDKSFRVNLRDSHSAQGTNRLQESFFCEHSHAWRETLKF